MAIKKVAVIGAGVMGAGIAAHVANAGIPVILLDIVPEGTDNRNIIGERAVEKLLKAKPAAFMHKKNARLLTTGNIEDHVDLLGEADWIIEVVIERLDIKQSLYKTIEAVRKPGSLVSSNTSTIPLAQLVEDMPASFQHDFLITHFFNPPRYMRLLELIASENRQPETIREFCDVKLGKGVVDCKDTPGFIGNRIGIFWLQCAVTEAISKGISVETADAVSGRPMGIPKTGVFGLIDLIGLDLMPHIINSMLASLPADDAFRAIGDIPERLRKMIADGFTGRKGKGGFYRLNTVDGKKIKESIDIASGEYRASQKPKLESLDAAKAGGLRALLEFDDDSGHYAMSVLTQTLAYTARVAPQIADDIVAIDRAMQLGYNWDYGPFELIDKIGVEWLVNKLEDQNIEAPALLKTTGNNRFYRVDNGQMHFLDFTGTYQPLRRPTGVTLLTDIKLRGKPVADNASASLWDIGDGVACLEFHSKMNALDIEIMDMINTSIEKVITGFGALIIHNEGVNFSAGANLEMLLLAIQNSDWQAVEKLLRMGQNTYCALKYAPFPAVAAPTGMALGGGCELLLHCDAVQAHSELYTGLVEAGVGLIPAWGGCKERLQRAFANKKRPGGPMPPVMQVFESVALASVSQSGEDAKMAQYLRPDDGITMNKDRLLIDAKQNALALSENYTPPQPPELNLPGPSAKAALDLAVQNLRLQGKATEYDKVVAGRLTYVLSGGDTDITQTLSEDNLLELEREAFLYLVQQPGTVARIEHMLNFGKPLRN